MVNVTKGKFIAFAVALCAVLAIIATPAYGFYYVHGDDYGVDPDTNGAYEVLCTLDTTAKGGTITTGLIFVPANSTAADCLKEMVYSSQSQNGQAAIHNYDVEAIGKLADSSSWTCTVYHADTQKPGTQVTHDVAGETGDPSTIVIERYDNVVFKAE